MTNPNPEKSLIEYPCDFPIKIMGAMQERFAETMVQLVSLHDPDFHAGKMDMRLDQGQLPVTDRDRARDQSRAAR